MADETPEIKPEDVGLHSLKPADGSRKDRKRVGRGHGSGHGKTSGRGHKAPRAVATALIALDIGLALQHLVDPDDVPLSLYPELYELLFAPLQAGKKVSRRSARSG